MATYLGLENLVLTSAVSANSSAPGLGPLNVLTEQGSADSAWQTAAGVVTLAAGALFRADFSPGARTIRAFAIARTNLTPAAQVTFQVWNAGPTFVYGSGALPGPVPRYGQVVHVLPANVTGDYLQIVFDDPTNPDGFINVPIIWCGALWQPGANVTWDSAYGRDHGADVRRARGGQTFIDTRYITRRFDMRLANVPESQWPTLDDYDHDVRLGHNTLIIPDHTSANLSREAVVGMVRPTADVTFPFGTAAARSWAARVEERL